MTDADEANGVRHEYRLCIDIPEDDEWAAQQIIGSWSDTLQEAQENLAKVDLSHYPVGALAVIEFRTITEWRTVQ